MPKIRKQRRKKKFRANVNRKRLRNKLLKLPTIECKEIEDSWEAKRSTRTNLRDMGLAYEPNEALKIPSTKRLYLKALKRKRLLSGIENGDNEDEDDDDDDESGKINGGRNKNIAEKIHVAESLEADAKAPRERLFRLPKSQVHFITYLMDKYDDDYKAMARDRKNYYQLTWCQIRAKINKFKSIPEQYADYLVKSGEIVLDDPTPLEETRKRIGEENAKKYSAPNINKVVKKKRKSSVWEVEDAEEVETSFHNGEKNLTDDSKDPAQKVKDGNGKGLKKLKLFSDDESDGDENDAGIDKRKNRIGGKEKGEDSQSKGGKIGEQKNVILKSEVGKKMRRSVAAIRKQESSDSDSDDENDELENDDVDDDDAEGLVNLSDLSEGEISEDDVLDDGEFVTDSNDENSD